ncbi:MAG: DEAD/DEAH box helicase [Sedimentisphaerales bacterium]|nr:DEAD/DEAH box helicase [Sedimentisphaerales bacterium]
MKSEGYTNPTPIQAKSIPILLDHKDLLGCAQTGTGKTAAFAIPIIQSILNNPSSPGRQKRIRALVLCPTRELAAQIDKSFTVYGRYTNIKSTVIFGGVPQRPQQEILKQGVDILTATPGRLLDLIGQGLISLDKLEWFVLDEADLMLDMGFIPDIKRIIAHLPSKRQSVFLSATMPPDAVKLASTILHKPVSVDVTEQISSADDINQSIFFVNKPDKGALLIDVLNHNNIDNALVFTRTKHGADKVARSLNKAGIQSQAIHGNKTQNSRTKALGDFKSRRTRVLVATDIAARGIDVSGLQMVINYELPNVAEMYVHRIGRTGRAGAGGTALSFCDTLEKPHLAEIHKLLAKKIPVATDFKSINQVNSQLSQIKTPLNQLNNMKTGKVKFFNREKGFGFIKDDESGQDYFVHKNGLVDHIKDGDEVSYELEKGPKGMNAVKVKVKNR